MKTTLKAMLLETIKLPSPEQQKWIKAYIAAADILLKHQNLTIGEDDRININAMITINELEQQYDEVPDYIRFGTSKYFGIANCTLTDLRIFPENATIISFFASSEMPSFRGIHKIVKTCDNLGINKTFVNGLIDCYKIKGLKKIAFTDNPKYALPKQLQGAVQLTNNALKLETNIFAYQNQMKDAGFKDFL